MFTFFFGKTPLTFLHENRHRTKRIRPSFAESSFFAIVSPNIEKHFKLRKQQEYKYQNSSHCFAVFTQVGQAMWLSELSADCEILDERRL